MTAHFQFFMILGAAILLLIIFALLKKGQMSVKYSLLWLALAVVLVIFAVFPYVGYVLRDLLDVQMPVNLVFMLMFCFVLLVLLSLSIGVSQLADKCKRLTQENAILEKRVRDLEKNPAPCSAPLLSAGCQLPVLLLGGQRPPAGTGFGCGNTGHMGLRAGDRQMPDRSRAGDFPAFGGVHLCGAFVLLQILEPVGGRYPERHGIAAPHGYGYPAGPGLLYPCCAQLHH